MKRWDLRAACLGVPCDVFYDAAPVYRQAKALCAACPVRAECLDAAIQEEQGIEWITHGYRAGMTAKARLRLARDEQHARNAGAA